MVTVPKSIKSLFYNPNKDSISSLFHEIKEAHGCILKRTDLLKGALLKDTDLKARLANNFEIPSDLGISKKALANVISSLFSGVPRWHSPRTMYNVAPSPVLPTVVTKFFTSLYNPNLALDTASGESLKTEQAIIGAIAKYIGWDRKKSGGVFTWGGKATIMYGIKLGLKESLPHSSKKGLKSDVVVLSTTAGHPCHISDAEWLGIGSDNVIRLKTDVHMKIDLENAERVMKKIIREGKTIAAIIISGGTTNNMVVDPISKVVSLRDRLVKENKMKYIPHVHVDAVVAFPWIFFKDYSFKRNPLYIIDEAKSKIEEIVRDLRDIYKADSFGIDFHKMGFCPYISSVFMVKDKGTLHGQEDVADWPFLYTLENSRSGDGPNTAFVALNVLGVTGYQVLLAYFTEMAIDLQKRLEETENFEVINKMSLGISVMFVPILPQGVPSRPAKMEAAVRNSYLTSFIEEISRLNNPYYIDLIPSDSTGANPYPFSSLKIYIMSPYATKKSNSEFVSFIVKLKKKVDSRFNFTRGQFTFEPAHPLSLKKLREINSTKRN